GSEHRLPARAIDAPVDRKLVVESNLQTHLGEGCLVANIIRETNQSFASLLYLQAVSLSESDTIKCVVIFFLSRFFKKAARGRRKHQHADSFTSFQRPSSEWLDNIQ